MKTSARRPRARGSPSGADAGASFGLVAPRLTAEEFYAIAAANASLLLPVFAIATRLRARFGGARFWARVTRARTRAGTMHLWSAADVLQARALARAAEDVISGAPSEGVGSGGMAKGGAAEACGAAACEAAAPGAAGAPPDAAPHRVEGDPRVTRAYVPPPKLNAPAPPAAAIVAARARPPRALARHRGALPPIIWDAWALGELAIVRESRAELPRESDAGTAY